MKKIKVTARFIMELVLTISIISFIILQLVSKTILNESYILSSMEKGDYYNKIYDAIQSNFENYIQQSGLDEKILENLVTKEQVIEDTKKIILNIYNGINEKLSTEKLKQKLQKNINSQLETNSLSNEQNKAIDEFIEKICEEYKNTISNSNYETQIYNGYKKVSKYLNLAKKVSIITIGISTTIIILLNLRRNYKIGTNIGTAFLASGTILTIINIYINTKIKIKYLTVLNEPMSIVIRNIAGDFLGNILKYGIMLILAGILLIIISNFIHNIVKYKHIMQDKPEEND